MEPLSLHVADSHSWHSAPGYSSGAARALRHAYALLRAGRRDLRSFVAAYNCLRPHLTRPMARHQYLRATYVMALTHAAAGDVPDAVAWCDDALALAAELDVPGAFVDLLDLRGECERTRLRFRESAADHRRALGIHRQLASQRLSPDVTTDDAQEMELLVQLAGSEFFLGEYASVRRRLDEANAIRRRTSIAPTTAATVEWWEAHLYRWSRQPARALQPALIAAQVYTESGSPASAARIQTFTADALLDMANSLPYGSDRDALIAAAGEHIALAQDLAQEAHDDIGAGLALLTEIRYSRMAEEIEGRIALAEAVIQLARREGDVALLAQAHTTLGDELAALDRPGAARNSYEQSLDILAGREMPALAVWAQSALHRAREQRDDN